MQSKPEILAGIFSPPVGTIRFASKVNVTQQLVGLVVIVYMGWLLDSSKAPDAMESIVLPSPENDGLYNPLIFLIISV
jgi:hypothetical protein